MPLIIKKVRGGAGSEEGRKTLEGMGGEERRGEERRGEERRGGEGRGILNIYVSVFIFNVGQ